MKTTKPKRGKDASKAVAPPAREEGTPSSQPELEDEDSEVVPPDAGSAEAEAEKEQERADDDGMPAEDPA